MTYGIRLVIDGVLQNLPEDMQPFVSSGRAFVPLRGIADAMGLDANWDSETSTVYISTPIPPRDLRGTEIIIGNWQQDWCTDTAIPQTEEEEARLQDRIYLQERYNFRIREVQLCDIIPADRRREVIALSVMAGDPFSHIISLEPDFFAELNEWGVFAALNDSIFTPEFGIRWHYPTIDSTRIDGIPFGWARDVEAEAQEEDIKVSAIFFGTYIVPSYWLTIDDIMFAYTQWNRSLPPS